MKTLVTAFGRMNVPTAGHGKLIDKIISVAKKEKADYKLFVSQSQDPKKNPLPYEKKISYIRKMFPKSNIQLNKSVKTFFDILRYASDAGYQKVIVIIGSDRFQEIERLKKYGPELGLTIEAVSAGERDPDADGVTGISASKMRAFAKNDDFESFKKGLPRGVSSSLAKSLFDDTQKAMGLMEAYEQDGIIVPRFGSSGRDACPQIDFNGMVEEIGHQNIFFDVVPVSSLIPTQGEFNSEIVLSIVKRLKYEESPALNAILVSSDMFIIDGHHRWLAAANAKTSVHVNIVNMTYDEFIEFCKGKSWVSFKNIEESECDGKKVNKPWSTPDGPKKSAVCGKNPGDENPTLVRFGDKNMTIKKHIPERRKSFRARHNCDTAKDKTSARYWSCKAW